MRIFLFLCLTCVLAVTSPVFAQTCTRSTFSPSVTICEPISGATVASPVHVTALTTAISSPVKFLRVFVDGVKQYEVQAGSLNAWLPMNAGTRKVEVQAEDGWLRKFGKIVYVTVGSGTPPPPPPTGTAPTIAALTPSAGIPGNRVTLTGTGFKSGATVTLGGVPATATFVSATQLSVTVPTMAPATVDVRVKNPDYLEAVKYGAFRVGKVYFKDSFDAGSFASWTAIWSSTDVLINANPAYVKSGPYSAQIHYYICGTCGASHQDHNRWFSKDFNSASGYPNGLNHFFIRGRVYFKSPEPGATKDGIARKIFYFKGPQLPGKDYEWAVILSSDGVLGQIRPYIGVVPKIGCTTCGSRNYYASSNELGTAPINLPYDQWITLEMEVKVNTPGSSNGELRYWVNGELRFQKRGIVLRDPSVTSGLTRFEIGRQVDRFNYNPVNEYRYWDDVVIADSYID